MFEKHREHEAEKERLHAVAVWQVRHDAYVEMIDTAKNFAGTSVVGLLLSAGETVFLTVTDTSLIEERRGRGTYQGHSQGISVPVMKVAGRQIRYRVGASKGHFVQGDLSPTAIDTGTTYITSTRVIFQGANQTRECAFAKMIGFDHASDTGTTTFSVSNRTKPTTIEYGESVVATFEFRLDLALAHFGGTLDELVSGLEADLVAVDGDRPDAAVVLPEAAPLAPPAEAALAPPAEAALAPPAEAALAPPAEAALAAVPVPAPPDSSATSSPPSPPPSPAPDPNAVPSAVAVEPPPVAEVAPRPVPAPGWFPDPWGVAPLRWWDGTAWSWQTVDPLSPTVPPA